MMSRPGTTSPDNNNTQQKQLLMFKIQDNTILAVTEDELVYLIDLAEHTVRVKWNDKVCHGSITPSRSPYPNVCWETPDGVSRRVSLGRICYEADAHDGSSYGGRHIHPADGDWLNLDPSNLIPKAERYTPEQVLAGQEAWGVRMGLREPSQDPRELLRQAHARIRDLEDQLAQYKKEAARA